MIKNLVQILGIKFGIIDKERAKITEFPSLMERAKAFEIAQDYVRLVAAKYPVKRVLLFGAYAAGNPHPDSDIDLAIILDEAENLFDIQGQMMILRKNEAVYIEPHPFRESDFVINDPFAAEIISTGVELEVPER
ncbi:MAG: hypothetical protein AMXMBFR48_19610 [Ignavibacteriales bacterium]